MSIDTSKIEVGDWVKQGDTWSRVVVDVESYDHNGFFTLKTEADCSGDITAHRPKSGPLKVGDEVIQHNSSGSTSGPLCITGPGEESESWYLDKHTDACDHSRNLTLHRPVEAIEAERDDNFRRAAEIEDKAGLGQAMREIQTDELLIAEVEKRGYEVRRIEKPVTLADLPREPMWCWEEEKAGIYYSEQEGDFWAIHFKSDDPAFVLERITAWACELAASGKIDRVIEGGIRAGQFDDAVTERAQVISCD